jgi:glycine dehydrogenase subunit 2
MMLTNPSTLGLFDRNARRACELLHEAGALVFCDGANMNALVGVARPADIGFDCMHLNLHKTFSTPHGGGGPGCRRGRCLGAAGSVPADPAHRADRRRAVRAVV